MYREGVGFQQTLHRCSCYEHCKYSTSFLITFLFFSLILLSSFLLQFMWSHPFTAKHIAILLELGLTIIDPISKTLACGDTGLGAMASVPTITEIVRKKVEEQSRES
jgi:hypothetical protein